MKRPSYEEALRSSHIRRQFKAAAVAVALLLLPSVRLRADTPRTPVVCDVASAREWCDTTALHPIEGVWIYPDDNVTVLVSRARKTPSMTYQRYDITVVATPDCTMTPGETIGNLEATADPRAYRLSLYSRKHKGHLDGMMSCAARLGDDDNLRVETPEIKLKLRINALSVLPKFWRTVRIGIDDPASRLKTGMIRIYPSYDGNGSRRGQPRYL